MNRAQSSMELLILLSMGLLAFVLLFSPAQEQITRSEGALRMQQVQSALSAVARAVEQAQAEGLGSQRRVDIELPEGLEGTLVGNKTLVAGFGQSLGRSDLSVATRADVYGFLPSTSGRHTVWVTSEGNRVRINTGIQALAVNPSFLYYLTYLNQTSQTTTLATTATNQGNQTITVSSQLVWTPGAVTVTLAQPGDALFVLTPSASNAIELAVSINPSAAGTYTGELLLNASNGDRAVVTITIEAVPVTIVQGGNATLGNVTRIRGMTCADAACTRWKVVFDDVSALPVDVHGTGWPPATNVTITIKDPANATVTGYPLNIIADGTGGFTHYLDPTNRTAGTYRVWANNSVFTVSYPFDLLGCS